MRLQELLLLVATLLVSIQTCKAANRIYKNSTQCYYLKMSEGQRANAYSPKSNPDLICCMCGKGTYWDGDCNPFNPISTICKPCHYSKEVPYDRSYVHFEPHDQEECFPHSVMQCPHPQVLFEGSAKEESKCLCPEGMIFGRTDKECIPDATVPIYSSKMTRLTTSDITTEPHTKQTPESTNAIKQTLLSRITTHDSATSTADSKNDIGANDEPMQKSSTQEMATPAEHYETETMSSNQDQNGIAMEPGLANGIIIGCTFLALAIILSLSFVSYHLNRNRKSRRLINESPQERRRAGTPQNLNGACNSSEALATGSNQDQSRMRNFSFGLDEDPQLENMAQPNPQRVNRNDELDTQPPESQPLIVQDRNEERECQNTANPLPTSDLPSEQNHTLFQIAHADDARQQIAQYSRHIASSPVHPAQPCQNAGRQAAAAMHPDEDAQAIPPQGAIQSLAIVQRSHETQARLDRRPQPELNEAERPRLNEREMNKRFALAIAKKMGEELDAKDAMPFYRLLIGRETVKMRDASNTYAAPGSRDTRELYYSLMQIATEELGVHLTRSYLLQKAEEHNLQILVDIIKEKMENPT